DRPLNTTYDQQPAGDPVAPVRPASAFAFLPPNSVSGGRNGGSGGGHGEREAGKRNIESLSDYVDNEVTPDQRRVIESHLIRCPHCADVLDALQTTDEMLEREWRESAPLPSSMELQQAVDSIMAALPPVPEQSATFAPKRVHSKTRWMRFSTGM